MNKYIYFLTFCGTVTKKKCKWVSEKTQSGPNPQFFQVFLRHSKMEVGSHYSLVEKRTEPIDETRSALNHNLFKPSKKKKAT